MPDDEMAVACRVDRLVNLADQAIHGFKLETCHAQWADGLRYDSVRKRPFMFESPDTGTEPSHEPYSV
jgi:hypothetical protein